MSIRIGLKIAAVKVRYSSLFRETYSFAMLVLGILFLPFNSVRAAGYLMASHRSTVNESRHIHVETLLKQHDLIKAQIMKPLVNFHPPDMERINQRLFKVKEKSGDERGVLISMFEVFNELGPEYDIRRILKDYHVVLEPSFACYCSPELLQLVDLKESRFIVMSAEKNDRDFLDRLDSNLIPIDIGSSDWVDERLFADLKLEKEYDCMCLGNWSEIKRLYLLLEALKKIGDKSYRACLVGAPLGGWTKQDVEDMARYYGVLDQVDLFEKITPDKVNELLNRSRVNVLLSQKEGANRSIFEGFFANTPGIVLTENVGVNKHYINKATGLLIDRDRLAETIIWFRENHDRFNPREWALENITCRRSTDKIEEKLKQIAVETGEPWTRSIEVKVNRPEMLYYDESVTMEPFRLNDYLAK